MQLWFVLVVALTPSLASAALFPKDTLVKQIDAKGFKKAMKENVCASPTSFHLLHYACRPPTPRMRCTACLSSSKFMRNIASPKCAP